MLDPNEFLSAISVPAIVAGILTLLRFAMIVWLSIVAVYSTRRQRRRAAVQVLHVLRPRWWRSS